MQSLVLCFASQRVAKFPEFCVVDVRDDVLDPDLGMVDQDNEFNETHCTRGYNWMESSLDPLPHGFAGLWWQLAICNDCGLRWRVPIWVEEEVCCMLQFSLEVSDKFFHLVD